jgi:hypothetical protein
MRAWMDGCKVVKVSGIKLCQTGRQTRRSLHKMKIIDMDATSIDGLLLLLCFISQNWYKLHKELFSHHGLLKLITNVI